MFWTRTQAETLNINWNPIDFCRYILQSRQITDWIQYSRFWLAKNLESILRATMVVARCRLSSPLGEQIHRNDVNFYFRFWIIDAVVNRISAEIHAHFEIYAHVILIECCCRCCSTTHLKFIPFLCDPNWLHIRE